MQEIKDTLSLIVSLQKDMQKNIGKLDAKIDHVEDKLNNKIDRNRTEMLFYYKNLDKKLDDNLKDIGEMFQELFTNMPA